MEDTRWRLNRVLSQCNLLVLIRLYVGAIELVCSKILLNCIQKENYCTKVLATIENH